MGTHRLVRISPFNSGTRETSFVAVEITPELPETDNLSVEDLDDKEFRLTPTGPVVRVVSTSTKPTRRCGLPTCQRAW